MLHRVGELEKEREEEEQVNKEVDGAGEGEEAGAEPREGHVEERKKYGNKHRDNDKDKC